MRSFGSDNNSGVHPEVFRLLSEANRDHVVGYGDDEYTKFAEKLLIKHFQGEANFNGEAEIHFVFNGTGANIIALSTGLQSFNSVICTEDSHINVDECGAPEKFTGSKLALVKDKITPDKIINLLENSKDQHHSQPKMVSLTQSTELGQLYTLEEIKNICDMCRQNDLYVHIDGARLSNAAAALNVSFKELTYDLGVDVVSFGGTKNGLMYGEAIIVFNDKLKNKAIYYRKQAGQLASKMRFISAQFIAYMQDDLWRKNANQANNMAKVFASKLEQIENIKIVHPVQVNSIFLQLPKNYIAKLQKRFFFYIWDYENSVIRLVTSFDTTLDDIKNFIGYLNSY
jgi:threonine aldolase